MAIDGHDVTRRFGRRRSTSSRPPWRDCQQVREVLVSRQRAMGEQGGVVMEGRDIGSVVFPNADVKIYLDASAEERARRRAHDTAHAGSQAVQAAVAEAIQARDLSDKTRAASPLALAPGAEQYRHHQYADRRRRGPRARTYQAETELTRARNGAKVRRCEGARVRGCGVRRCEVRVSPTLLTFDRCNCCNVLTFQRCLVRLRARIDACTNRVHGWSTTFRRARLLEVGERAKA